MIQEIRFESGIFTVTAAVLAALKAMVDGNKDNLAAIQKQHQITLTLLSELQFVLLCVLNLELEM